jgi:hypothetical protein
VSGGIQVLNFALWAKLTLVQREKKDCHPGFQEAQVRALGASTGSRNIKQSVDLDTQFVLGARVSPNSLWCDAQVEIECLPGAEFHFDPAASMENVTQF